MTIATSTGRIQYNGNGATTEFATNFKLLDASHVEVTLTSAAGVDTVQTITTHYTVALGASTATVTMLTAPASGEKLTLRLSVPLTQTYDLVNGQAFNADTIENALDLGTQVDQGLSETFSRTLKMPTSATTSFEGTLPSATSDYILRVNSDSTGFEAVDAATAFAEGGGGDFTDIIYDSTPQLGGDLDVNGNDITGLTPSGGSTSQNLSAMLGKKLSAVDFGATGDGTSNDSAAFTALEAAVSKREIDLLHKVYLVTSIPTGNKYINGAFKVGNILHPTEGYLEDEFSRVTNTRNYTTWAQDKAFVHDKAIYVPHHLAHRHTVTDQQVVWTKSFDSGESYTAPEILLPVPEDTSYGFNCFSAGVVGNRFCMLVEKRDSGTLELLTTFLYTRPMSKHYVVSGGISITSGSAIATITVPDHGLKAGDVVAFTGVDDPGSGQLSGLSGNRTVDSWVDKDTFTIDKGSNATGTVSDAGGDYVLAVSIHGQDWDITDLGDFDTGGVAASHVHSFAVKDADLGSFFVGYHNGAVPGREIGVIEITDLFTSPVATKRAGPSGLASYQAEPCIRYEGSTLYMSTRSQGSAEPSKFGYSTDSGVTWTYADIDIDGLVFSYVEPTPFEIVGDDVYMFATERGEGDFDGNGPNRSSQSNPRIFMLKDTLANFKSGTFTNTEVYVVGRAKYQGEIASPGTGVGSTTQLDGSVYYFFGSEDWSIATQYSDNLLQTYNEEIADGYQPDLYCYKITVTENTEFKPIRNAAYDASQVQEYSMLGSSGTEHQSEVRYNETQTFLDARGGFSWVKESVTISSGEATVAAGTGHVELDTESSASTDDLDTITYASPVEGQLIVLSGTSSSRDVTVKHGTDNIVLAGGEDVTLSSNTDMVTLIYKGSSWCEVSRPHVPIPSGTSNLTISSGAVTLTSGVNTFFVSTEGGAATDDLDTVTDADAYDGKIIYLGGFSSSRDVTYKDGTGNLILDGDFATTVASHRLTLQYYNGNWFEISRSAN